MAERDEPTQRDDDQSLQGRLRKVTRARYLENTLEKTDSALGLAVSATETGLFSFDSVDKLSPIQLRG